MRFLAKNPDSSRKMSDPEEKPPLELADDTMPLPTWNRFTQESTLHGIKYIFDGSQMRLRRMLWGVTVLVAVGGFVIQVGIRAGDFFEYKTNVAVEVIYTRRVKFPAVTICNQNSFRITKAVDAGLYTMLDDMFSTENVNVSDIDFTRYDMTISTEEFFVNASHQIDNLLHRCTWQKEFCGPDDFVQTKTDFGICYTFNSGQDSPVMEISNSGSQTALSLVLNIEQFQYMKGPQNDAGIKIMLHDQKEFPSVENLGFSIPPGTHTLVGIKQFDIKTLSKPYGDCAIEDYPLSYCQVDCRGRSMVRECSCRDVYIRENVTEGIFPVCPLDVLYSCARPLAGKLEVQSSECNCKVPCDRIVYEPSLSYTQFSKLNAHKMVLQGDIDTEDLRHQFLQAREYSQRHVTEFATRDKTRLSSILNKKAELNDFVEWLSHSLSQGTKMENVSLTMNEAVLADYDTLWHNGEVLSRVITGQILDFTTTANYFTTLYEDLLVIIPQYEIPNLITMFLLYRGVTLDIPATGGDYSFLGHWLRQCLDDGFTPPSFDGNSQEAVCGGIFERRSGQIVGVPDDINCTELVFSVRRCGRHLLAEMENTENQLLGGGVLTENAIRQLLVGTPASYDDWQALHSCIRLMNETSVTLTTWMPSMKAHLEDLIGAQTMADLLASTDTFVDFLQNDSSPRVYGHQSLYEVGWEGYSAFQFCVTFGIAELFYSRKRKVTDRLEDIETASAMMSEKTTHLRQTVMAFNTTSRHLDIYLENMTLAYTTGNMTKLDMVRVLDSEHVSKLLTALYSYESDVGGIIGELFTCLQRLTEAFRNFYDTTFKFKLPLIRYEHMGNLSMVQLWRTLDESDWYIDESGSCCAEADVFASVENLANIQKQQWDAIRMECSLKVTSVRNMVGIFQEELRVYADQSQMDWRFIMDNFLQVDIFYKELGYERIEQHAAFQSLSLLGEIGGFLGLLLGASVLTVVELLDYVILNIVRRCRKKVSPLSAGHQTSTPVVKM